MPGPCPLNTVFPLTTIVPDVRKVPSVMTTSPPLASALFSSTWSLTPSQMYCAEAFEVALASLAATIVAAMADCANKTIPRMSAQRTSFQTFINHPLVDQYRNV